MRALAHCLETNFVRERKLSSNEVSLMLCWSVSPIENCDLYQKICLLKSTFRSQNRHENYFLRSLFECENFALFGFQIDMKTFQEINFSVVFLLLFNFLGLDHRSLSYEYTIEFMYFGAIAGQRIEGFDKSFDNCVAV